MALKTSAQIGQIIRNAVIFNPQNWDDISMEADSLVKSVQQLFKQLEAHDIPYVLVGGVALLHYVEGRNTQDINLLMDPNLLVQLPTIEKITQDNNFMRARYKQLRIDVLATDNPLFALVFDKHAKSVELFDYTIRIATVEGLILLKLYALPSLYRQGDFVRVGLYENDIATLTHHYQPRIEAIVDKLSPFLSPSDIAECRNIVTDIKTRLSRFR